MDGVSLSPVEFCHDCEGLGRISSSEIDLVIWRRTLPDAFSAWIEKVPFSRLPSFRILVRLSELSGAVSALMDESGLPKGEMRDCLIDDLHSLAARFCSITGEDRIDLRLERIRHDACWKFHRDCVPVRLLTTYRGPATEWVMPGFADTAIRDQLDYSGPVETLAPQDVAIFKGVASDKGRGIVHRSPAVSGSGETRLLLCLNVPSDISPKEWPQR